MIPKLLLDMNIPIGWVEVLSEPGVDAVHWSNVGDPRATDREIMSWAVENDRVVFTHDLESHSEDLEQGALIVVDESTTVNLTCSSRLDGHNRWEKRGGPLSSQPLAGRCRNLVD